MQTQSNGFQVIRAAFRGGLWPYECSQLASYLRRHRLPEAAVRVLARLTEYGLVPEVATALLEEMCKRVGVAGLERQLAWLEQTGILENGPGSPRRHAKDAPLRFYRALWGLVEAGYSTHDALDLLQDCWQAVERPEQFDLVLDYLTSGQQPGLVLELLGRFEPAEAVPLAESIGRPVGRTSAGARLGGFLARLPVGASPAVCLAAYRLYARLLAEGVTSAESLGGLLQRLVGMRPERARGLLDTVAALPGSVDLHLAKLAWSEDLDDAFKRLLRPRPLVLQAPARTVWVRLRRWLARAA
ncbi:MAG: hypothetical protein KC910_32385 [Candidatus Eremiobacteraeota bacterium]|nr:hypothetical protein [Candidatus Eremiobacteraeota bacterium]